MTAVTPNGTRQTFMAVVQTVIAVSAIALVGLAFNANQYVNTLRTEFDSYQKMVANEFLHLRESITLMRSDIKKLEDGK